MSGAPPSRKRSRSAVAAVDAAPPFARPRLRLKAAHGASSLEKGRLGPSAAMASLSLITYARLVNRDFPGAAAAMSSLLERYRRVGRSSWYFPREAAAVGGCISRRMGHTEGFLAALARDGLSGSRAAVAVGAPLTRSIALVEAALDAVAAGRARHARDLLAAEVALPAFEGACLVHTYFGLISLALAGEAVPDRELLLSDASNALSTAARLDPDMYMAAHACAAAEVASRPTDLRAGLDILRQFASTATYNAFAQSALLKALRLLPSPPRQEVVETARLLMEADPLSEDALKTLREAAAWTWNVDPPVSRGEVAAASATVVEHGAGSVKTWKLLADCLSECSEAERVSFWSGAGRDRWWPSHFFRSAKVNVDNVVPGLVRVKVSVAEMLDASIAYINTASQGGGAC